VQRSVQRNLPVRWHRLCGQLADNRQNGFIDSYLETENYPRPLLLSSVASRYI